MYDKQFLLKLDQEKHKIIYAKVISLTFDERPIEQIEGKIISGSINIDGNSAVRRTCQLSLLAKDLNINEYYWGEKTKFKLEIGVQNTIDNKYPSIVWFPQGIFVISSFSLALSPNSYTINLSGKDKMCLLNGDVGGTLPTAVDFGQLEEQDNDGNVRRIKIPVKDIIRNIVHVFGNEAQHNIIINDIQKYGLELLEYRYDSPMFLLRYKNQNSYYNAVLDIQTPCWYYDNNNKAKATALGDITNVDNYYRNDELSYDSLNQNFTDAIQPTTISLQVIETTEIVDGKEKIVYLPDENYEPDTQVAFIHFGNTAGYRETELTYPGELIGNIGETLTSVLDKIKNMLGNFEYFYDLDGKFIFQEKKNYINTSFSPLKSDENGSSYIENLIHNPEIFYNFENANLISTINNSPNFNNVKNDYSVWGTKTSISGAEQLVHMRYAIDIRPQQYCSITVTDEELRDYNKKYNCSAKGQPSVLYQAGSEYVINKDNPNLTIITCDWREIIYQMAMDYDKYNHLDNFEIKIIEANKPYGNYLDGRTKYEQYYYDMLSFWRLLYNPPLLIQSEQKSGILQVDDLGDFYLDKPNEELAFEENPENYYTEGQYAFWAKNIYENPETLTFWLDFLDTKSSLAKFSTKTIGDRVKSLNDSDVTAIYYRDTPGIVFTTYEKFTSLVEQDPSYRYFLSSNFTDMFSVSAQGKSAKEKIDELLYTHAYTTDTITMNVVPIYYLEPNVKIHISNDKSHINGNYIITKISVQLGAGKMMSVTATKINDYLI